MLGIRCRSSGCEGMCMCMISHGCNGRLFIFMSWRYGEIIAGVGIFVMLPGKAYVLWMRVSSPPLAGV